MKSEGYYRRMERDASLYTQTVLDSKDLKKLVVAGPGAGKTHLFEEVCKRCDSTNILILSFINELVNDLKRSLDQYGSVRTLHSFACRELKQSNFFMKLTKVIDEDYFAAEGKEISFEDVFSNLRTEMRDEISFYMSRRKHYDHIGPNCSVYLLVKHYENSPTRVHKYSQILIDEFQDFNKLEIHLIKILAKSSPILIAGDDDQSLYSFRYAVPGEIRNIYEGDEYRNFDLPYCRRCPEVIIRAVKNVLDSAREMGLFSKRIPKDFKYLPSEERDKISAMNKEIEVKRPIYKGVLASNLDWDIQKIYKQDKDASVLILFPNKLKKHIPGVEKTLRSKGYRKIDTPTFKNNTLTLSDGYGLLLDDSRSKLGWRIIAKEKFKADVFAEYSKKSLADDSSFETLIDKSLKEEVKSNLVLLTKAIKTGELSADEASSLFKELGYDPIKNTIRELRNDFNNDYTASEGYHSVPIKMTTILGSKGLTDNYTFLVKFDDKAVLEDPTNITEEEVCNFLVAITRSRKKVFIYSAEDKRPTFVDWLGPNVRSEKIISYEKH